MKLNKRSAQANQKSKTVFSSVSVPTSEFWLSQWLVSNRKKLSILSVLWQPREVGLVWTKLFGCSSFASDCNRVAYLRVCRLPSATSERNAQRIQRELQPFGFQESRQCDFRGKVRRLVMKNYNCISWLSHFINRWNVALLNILLWIKKNIRKCYTFYNQIKLQACTS